MIGREIAGELHQQNLLEISTLGSRVSHLRHSATQTTQCVCVCMCVHVCACTCGGCWREATGWWTLGKLHVLQWLNTKAVVCAAGARPWRNHVYCQNLLKEYPGTRKEHLFLPKRLSKPPTDKVHSHQLGKEPY